jgi:dipeptidyl aminopeptidase/acylaminoacyl peptidase
VPRIGTTPVARVCRWLAAPLVLILLGADIRAEPLTIPRYFALRAITGCAISPDGLEVAYTEERLNADTGADVSDLLLVRTAGATPERIATSPGLRTSPAWSPDGKALAYILDAGGKRALAIWNRDARAERRVSPPTLAVVRFEWAPDSRRLAVVASRTGGDPAQPIVRSALPKPQQVYVIDLQTRGLTRRAENAGTVDYVSWSPDGRALAMSARPARTAHDLMYRTSISILNVASNSVRSIVSRPGLNTMPKWSPDGSSIAFLSSDGHEDYLGVTYLCVVSPAGGPIRNLTPSFDERIVPVTTPFLAWTRDSRSVLFSLPRGVARLLYRISLSDAGVTAMNPPDRVYSDFSLARDVDRMALLVSDPVTPWELFVSGVSSFAPERLATANPDLDRTAFGTSKLIEWKADDGQLLQGLLVFPPKYDAKRTYPMITYLHGGPSSVFTWSFAPQVPSADIAQVEPLAPQVFPSRGYVVFLPNPRGSGGYGQRFMKANVHRSPDLETDDAVSGVRHLVQEGIADPARLGIMGWSAGGEETAWAISHSDLFRAAVVGAGTVDETAGFGGQYHPDLTLAYMLAAPWDEPQEYVAHSSIYFARRIHTPTLIFNGADDDAVPPVEGQELFRALSELGVPTEQLTYPGQGHNFSDPRYMRDVVERTVQWFDRWLHPASHD